MDDDGKSQAKGLEPRASDTLEEEPDLPPVVARMVVEIRSDGSKTVARGALEDLTTGQKVALRADAGTPFELARELSRSILRMPSLTATLAKETAKQWVRAPLSKWKERRKLRD